MNLEINKSTIIIIGNIWLAISTLHTGIPFMLCYGLGILCIIIFIFIKESKN